MTACFPDVGVSLNGGTPISHPKMIHHLVGKPMVLGETHHFRNLPCRTRAENPSDQPTFSSSKELMLESQGMDLENPKLAVWGPGFFGILGIPFSNNPGFTFGDPTNSKPPGKKKTPIHHFCWGLNTIGKSSPQVVAKRKKIKTTNLVGDFVGEDWWRNKFFKFGKQTDLMSRILRIGDLKRQHIWRKQGFVFPHQIENTYRFGKQTNSS